MTGGETGRRNRNRYVYREYACRLYNGDQAAGPDYRPLGPLARKIGGPDDRELQNINGR